MGQLEQALQRVNLLFDACDRWLRDAEDPSRYDVGPRAEEVSVVYVEAGYDGRPVRRKAPLSELLARVEGLDLTVRLVEVKHSDPRDLLLKTAGRLQGHLELLAKLVGELQPDGVTVNLLVSPEWQRTRAALLTALAAHPAARQAVAAALGEVERDARN
jgi:hypothetical protein